MPLPLGDCADDIPTEVCCPTLFGIADRIRCIATDAVLGCLGPDCAERDFRSIVAMAPHEDFFGDILSVSLTNWTLSADTRPPIVLTVATYRLELWETGWPVPEVDEQANLISVPDAELVNALARHVYSHGEVMYRALLDVAARRQFWNDTIGLPTDGFSKFTVGALTPIAPAGRLVGWGVNLQVRWNPGPGVRGS